MKALNAREYNYSKKEEISFVQLYIDNSEDLEVYIERDILIKTKILMKFYMGFISQDYKHCINDYMIHQRENKVYNFLNPVTLFVSMKYKSPHTLLTFIDEYNNLYGKVYDNMRNYIKENKVVCINNNGGHITLNKTDIDYNNVFDITIKQMDNFILFLPIDSDLSFTKGNNVLLIENGDNEPKRLVEKIKHDYVNSEIFIFNRFKTSTILWSNEDWLSYFQKAINNGLKIITFKTTGQDISQITDMKKLLEKIMSINKFHELLILYSCHKDLNISSELPNIKIERIVI